jgi:putative ABC transport system permease protein
MSRLAFRNLFQNKVRLLASSGGVALALVLILALDAVFTGSEHRLTAYIDNSGADVWVSQAGVRNIHMASSSLPASTVDRVEAVPGVESVTPILYVSNLVAIGEERSYAYVIGLPPEPAAGKPWSVPEGVAVPGPGEAVLSRAVARASGAGLGDTAQILGADFRIVGLSEGTSNLSNSIAFITAADFQRLRRSPELVSYLLVRIRPGESTAEVARRIEGAVAGVSASTRAEFSEQEGRLVKDMSADVLTIMNFVGALIGLAVLALTVYTATLARRREYGVLKALGARNAVLYRTVVAQAFYSVGLGLALGVALTLLLTLVVPALTPNLPLDLSAESVLKVAAVSFVLAGLAALLPVRQIAGLDPAMVFRGK